MIKCSKKFSLILGGLTLALPNVIPTYAWSLSPSEALERDEQLPRGRSLNMDDDQRYLFPDGFLQDDDSLVVPRLPTEINLFYKTKFEKEVEIQHQEKMRLQMSNSGRDGATVTVIVTHMDSETLLWEQSFSVGGGDSDEVEIPAATKLADLDLPAGALQVQVVTERFIWSKSKVHTAVSVEPECRESFPQSCRCGVSLYPIKKGHAYIGDTDGGVQIVAKCESFQYSNQNNFRGILRFTRDKFEPTGKKQTCELMKLGTRGKQSLEFLPGDLFWAECTGQGKEPDFGLLGEVQERIK